MKQNFEEFKILTIVFIQFIDLIDFGENLAFYRVLKTAFNLYFLQDLVQQRLDRLIHSILFPYPQILEDNLIFG